MKDARQSSQILALCETGTDPENDETILPQESIPVQPEGLFDPVSDSLDGDGGILTDPTVMYAQSLLNSKPFNLTRDLTDLVAGPA